MGRFVGSRVVGSRIEHLIEMEILLIELKNKMKHYLSYGRRCTIQGCYLRFFRVAKLSFLLAIFLAQAVPVSAQSITGDGISLDELLRMLNQGESIDGQKVNMRSVNFELNSTELNSESKAYLDRVVQLLTITDKLNLKIVGHTDNVGDDGDNQRLSEARAFSVSNYLTANGISSGRISVFGSGESQPIASNDSEEGRRLNRRVEFDVISINSEKGGKQIPLQDIVFLVDGSKIGAYNIVMEDGAIRYKQFDDSSTKRLPLSQVKSISYSNGEVYSPAKAAKKLEVPEGTWKNQDPNTDGLTTVKIRKQGGDYLVRMYGKCHPEDCDWGELAIPVSESADNQFLLHWNHNGIIADQTVKYLPEKDLLSVETKTRFEDGSGRQAYSSTEYFKRGEVQRQELLASAIKLNAGGFRFSGAYVTIGSQRNVLPGSNVEFLFTDDSPSKNQFYQYIDLGASSGTFDIGLELSRKRWDFAAGYHGFWGTVSGGGFLPEVGYRLIDLSGIMIRPSLGLYLGQSNVYFGEMERVNEFIQVNERKYYGDYVDVTLKKSQIAASPNVTVDFPVRHSFNILRLKFGCNLSMFSGNGRMVFEGLDGGKNRSERKPLSSSTSFQVDGQEATRFPVRTTGLFFQIGYLIR